MNSFSQREAMTIFVIFFGITLIDAVTTAEWWRAAFWISIAGAFWALSRRGHKAHKRQRPTAL